MNKHQVECTNRVTDDNSNLGRDVARFVSRSEGLGTNDITHAICDQVEGPDSCFLGVASNVARDEREESHETGG